MDPYCGLLNPANLSVRDPPPLIGIFKDPQIFVPSTKDPINSDSKKPRKSSKWEKVVACPHCTSTFANIQEFYLHGNKDHQDIIDGIWNKCDKCSMSFPTTTALKQHSDRYHSNKKTRTYPATRVRCEFCPQTCGKTSTYYKHANSDHEDIISKIWRPCPVCTLYFPNPNSLRYHHDIVHLKKGRDETSVKAKQIMCTFCPMTFKKPCFFYKHANANHMDVLPTQWISCAVCKVYFPNKTSLNYHSDFVHVRREGMQSRDTSAPTHTCDYCIKTFKKTCYLYRHVNLEHLELIADLWLKCHSCQTYFPTEGSLKCHKEIVHKREENPNFVSSKVSCLFCPESFRRPAFMHRHCNEVHLNEIKSSWPQCNECSMHLPSVRSLKSHKDFSHTRGFWKKAAVESKKAVQCSFCDEVCKTMALYYKHANQNHREDIVTKNWFECSDCGMMLPSQTILKYHFDFAHQRHLWKEDELNNKKSILDFEPETKRLRGKIVDDPDSDELEDAPLKQMKKRHRKSREKQRGKNSDTPWHVKMEDPPSCDVEIKQEVIEDDGDIAANGSRSADVTKPVEPVRPPLPKLIIKRDEIIKVEPKIEGLLETSKIDGPVDCKTCGRTFSRSSYLRRHENIHTGVTTCKICGRVMSRILELRLHMKRIHGDILDLNFDENDSAATDDIHDMSRFLDIQVKVEDEKDTSDNADSFDEHDSCSVDKQDGEEDDDEVYLDGEVTTEDYEPQPLNAFRNTGNEKNT